MSWKNIVATVAPTIGMAIGGPLGGLAANVVCQALGIDPKSTDDDIERQLLSSPEQLAKVQMADIAFKQRLAELNIDLEKIAAEDRDSARQREIQVKDLTPRLLAFGVTIGFFGVLIWMLEHGVTQPGNEALLLLLGALTTAWISVMQYYFGSSSGSDKKSDLLAKIK